MSDELTFLVSRVFGAGLGYLLAMISLLFFEDEIFRGINWVVYKVRASLGLD